MSHCHWEPSGSLGLRLEATGRIHVGRRGASVGVRDPLATGGPICRRVRSAR